MEFPSLSLSTPPLDSNPNALLELSPGAPCSEPNFEELFCESNTLPNMAVEFPPTDSQFLDSNLAELKFMAIYLLIEDIEPEVLNWLLSFMMLA